MFVCVCSTREDVALTRLLIHRLILRLLGTYGSRDCAERWVPGSEETDTVLVPGRGLQSSDEDRHQSLNTQMGSSSNMLG